MRKNKGGRGGIERKEAEKKNEGKETEKKGVKEARQRE